ncbi:MAG TPA: GntR family transcriptional regulator [Thermomicrobiales bacterium]|nr:GntR family transcriptional regulator [Thermomicrobiales bacterium]
MRYSSMSLGRTQMNEGFDENARFEWLLHHGFDAIDDAHATKRRPLTKSQRAYASLRRAIVTHGLPSGIPLDEGMLLDRIPYGRTPLREALKQLSFEGLLVWSPRQAPAIRDIALHEIRHLYEMREFIEPQAAGLAAERATEDDKASMQALRDELVAVTSQGKVYEAVELDYALHASIARATQNRFLEEASVTLNRQSLRLWYRAQRAIGVENIHRSHSELVEAICTGDHKRAKALAVRHIETSRERQWAVVEGRRRTEPKSPDDRSDTSNSE